jgi:thiamine biosynthesis protein ThiS
MLVTRPHPRLAGIVSEAVQGGVNLVQLRDKDGRPPSDLLGIVRELRGLFSVERARIVVNGPPDLAIDDVIEAGADGIHLPEAAPLRVACRHLAGRSVHSTGAALRAETEGASYLVFGTVFDSPSHPGQEPAGIEALRRVCRVVSLPVLAIGGVTPANTLECVAAGAAGVAVLSPVMDAESPRQVADRYREALGIRVSSMVEATINGKSVTLEEPLTIREFLRTRGLHEQIVVVEHNREIVPRDRYGEVTLRSDDVVEIVQMTAGG